MRASAALALGLTCFALSTPQLAWAGPPADTLAPAMPEGPSAPALEPAPLEPAPLEPAPLEPAPLEPAPPGTTVEGPAQTDELPSWDSQAPGTAQVYEPELAGERERRDVPYDGKGAMVFGSILAVGGLAATSLGVAALADGWIGWGASGMGFGVPALGVGVGVTALGVKRHRAYRTWEANTTLRPPSAGRGLLGAGFGTMFGGTALLIVAGMSNLTFWEYKWWIPTGYAVGGVAVATSIGLLMAGSARNGRFNNWKKGTPLPTASFGPHGVVVGVAGRF